MTLAQTLSTYVTLNLLIAIGFVGLVLYRPLETRFRGRARASLFLNLHYSLLFLVMAITVAHPLLPKKEFFHPIARVWAGPSFKTFNQDRSLLGDGGLLMLSTGSGAPLLQADQASILLSSILLLVLGFVAVRLGRDLAQLRQIRVSSFLFRRIGGVSLFANDKIKVPFSYWVPGNAIIVIPSPLLGRAEDRKIAVAHELQHHRQADTRWVYVIWILRAICVINPLIHLWSRWLSELQEFACDETLVDLKKVESRQYARCLIEVAETALNQEYIPACASGLVFLVERNLLKRRIEAMLNPNPKCVTRSISWIAGITLTALMTVTALASQTIVQDRRVTMEDAKSMASVAQTDDFPIVVNDLVLKELNRFIGTPDGRDFIRLSLQRMESFRPYIEGKISEYEVPTELLVIPIIESGYQNLSPNSQHGVGAGLWMFIVGTAQNFGLRVDGQVDDRLDFRLETDAAIRLLKSDRLRFNDWLLAVMAYNVGEAKIQRGITETGSRDAWNLVRSGYENDNAYLARVMAAILIMKNPASVSR